jgi:hypothetical protein
VEKDCVPENPYIPEMVDNYNKFVQSCLARSHVANVGVAEYDNNDPTMGIVRLNQVRVCVCICASMSLRFCVSSSVSLHRSASSPPRAH